jgi:hypothetical protein
MVRRTIQPPFPAFANAGLSSRIRSLPDRPVVHGAPEKPLLRIACGDPQHCVGLMSLPIMCLACPRAKSSPAARNGNQEIPIVKYVVLCVSAFLTFGTAGLSLAGPPEKSTILHCGCNETADGMVYVEITISSKSRGHDQHVAGSIESCFDGVDSYNDVVRTGSDCQASGPELRDPIDACGEQIAGDECGALVID